MEKNLPKESKENNYFSKENENSILKFQQEIDLEIKKKIFVEEIKPAFSKLIENLIFVYKFHSLGNLDILKSDCLSFLFESLNKFDSTKGSKAFSYFNVIAKNWLVQRVKIHKKKLQADVSFDATVLADLEKNNDKSVVMSLEDDLMDYEFLLLLKEEMNTWDERFSKDHEKKILDAIRLLLNNPDSLSIYNKKGIYLCLREITGMTTKQIVSNLSKFKKRYQSFKKRYLDGEV